MKSQDAIKDLLDQRDALNSVAHLLLNELDGLLCAVKHGNPDVVSEMVEDCESVIEHAKKVLLPV